MKYYSIYIRGMKSFFTYKSEQNLKIGEWVLVPFRKKEILGIVIKEERIQEYKFNVLEVISKVNFINISKELIELMLWIGDYYLCNFNDTLTLLYPNTLNSDSKEKIILGDFESSNQEENTIRKYMLKRGIVTLKVLKKNFNSLVIDELLHRKALIVNK